MRSWSSIRLLAAGAVAVGLVVGHAAPSDAHPPPFWRMPDLSADRRAGLELVPTIGDAVGERALVIDAGVFAELDLRPWLVLAARVPFSYVHSTPDGGGDVTSFALGNVGLGLRLVDSGPRRRTGRWRYGLGTWLYAPTASDGGEAGGAATITTRFTAPEEARYFDATTLRFDGDLRFEGRSVFFQTEFGLAYHRSSSGDDLDGRFAAGLGLMFSHYIAALAEFTLQIEGPDTGVTPVLDLGVRYHAPSVMTGLRLYWPLGEDQRDRGIIGLGVDVAARF